MRRRPSLCLPATERNPLNRPQRWHNRLSNQAEYRRTRTSFMGFGNRIAGCFSFRCAKGGLAPNGGRCHANAAWWCLRRQFPRSVTCCPVPWSNSDTMTWLTGPWDSGALRTVDFEEDSRPGRLSAAESPALPECSGRRRPDPPPSHHRAKRQALAPSEEITGPPALKTGDHSHANSPGWASRFQRHRLRWRRPPAVSPLPPGHHGAAFRA